MIIVENLPNGRTHTYSDSGMKIRQLDTGAIFDDAIDTVPHEYVETNIPIETSAEEEPTAEELLNIITGGAT